MSIFEETKAFLGDNKFPNSYRGETFVFSRISAEDTSKGFYLVREIKDNMLVGNIIIDENGEITIKVLQDKYASDLCRACIECGRTVNPKSNGMG